MFPSYTTPTQRTHSDSMGEWCQWADIAKGTYTIRELTVNALRAVRREWNRFSIFLTVSSPFISLHNITGFLPLWAALFMFTAKLHEPEVYNSFRFGHSWQNFKKIWFPWHLGGRSVTIGPKFWELIFLVDNCFSRELRLCQPLRWILYFNTLFVISATLKPRLAYRPERRIWQ